MKKRHNGQFVIVALLQTDWRTAVPLSVFARFAIRVSLRVWNFLGSGLGASCSLSSHNSMMAGQHQPDCAHWATCEFIRVTPQDNLYMLAWNVHIGRASGREPAKLGTVREESKVACVAQSPGICEQK